MRQCRGRASWGTDGVSAPPLDAHRTGGDRGHRHLHTRVLLGSPRDHFEDEEDEAQRGAQLRVTERTRTRPRGPGLAAAQQRWDYECASHAPVPHLGACPREACLAPADSREGARVLPTQARASSEGPRSLCSPPQHAGRPDVVTDPRGGSPSCALGREPSSCRCHPSTFLKPGLLSARGFGLISVHP